MEQFSVDLLNEYIPKQYRKKVSQELVDNLNELIEDPDYGESFKENFITHSHILSGKTTYSLKAYVSATKFYCLTALGMKYVDAYTRVFPERLQTRMARGESKVDMGGEASRFNQSPMVNDIRSRAAVPLHLFNQANVQLGINTLVDVCTNSRSDIARTSAALGLIKELRPAETQQIEMQLGLSDEAKEAQEKQNAHLIEIAENQRRLLAAGVSINDVQQISISKKEHIEVELDE